LVKSDLKVLIVSQVDTLDELLGVLLVEHFEYRVDVLLVLQVELFLISRILGGCLSGCELLLSGFDLLNLDLLPLLKGLKDHEHEVLFPIRHETILYQIHSRVDIDLLEDSLNERDAKNLIGAA
jgi:hypothetical protein